MKGLQGIDIEYEVLSSGETIKGLNGIDVEYELAASFDPYNGFLGISTEFPEGYQIWLSDYANRPLSNATVTIYDSADNSNNVSGTTDWNGYILLQPAEYWNNNKVVVHSNRLGTFVYWATKEELFEVLNLELDRYNLVV